MERKNSTNVEIVDHTIVSKKTQKVLAKESWVIDPTKKESLKKTIQELLNLAEYAPYHYKIDEKYYANAKSELNSCVPWRFYVLDTEACRYLHAYIQNPAVKKDKIRDMLAAADALLMVTWLPHPSRKDTQDVTIDRMFEPLPFDGNGMNMEHIAATSCAIQNVLIGATARNIHTYWSSGGKLRDKVARDYLGIPMHEILLGAIFLFPEDAEKRDSTIISGVKRNEGKEPSTWSRWLDLSEGMDV